MDIEAENIPKKLEGKVGAMVVCCILGIGQLVAWNTILTISDYYYQVFPEYHPSRVLTLVYQPFALGTIFILVFMRKTNKNQNRIIIGYAIFFIGTLLLIITWPQKEKGHLSAYILLCSIVACFGIANTLVHGAIAGELSFMCPKLIQSFVAGLGVAGAITSALRLITKAVFDKSPNGLRKGALMSLGFSTLIDFTCVVLYVQVFPKLPVVKYYAKAESNHLEAGEGRIVRLSNKELLYQNVNLAINLFLIYALTFSIFPGFLYENTGEDHELGSWYTLVLVASFTVWDAFSRYIPLSKHLQIESRKWITVCVLMQFLCIPAFYFTAKNTGQGWMVFLTSSLGLTNGYLTVCVLTGTPKRTYNVLETNALGNLLVGFILGGTFAGVCLSLALANRHQEFLLEI